MKNVTIAIRLVRTSNPKLVKITATLAMLVFPPLCIVLGFDARTTGVMLGGTIHDVAQVVGAGYAVSEPVGNTAVIVKLFRVFLLLPVVLGVGWYFTRKGIRHGEARVPVPGFAIVFLLLPVVLSVGWYFTRKGIKHGEARVPVPGFAIVFLLLCILNSAASLAPSWMPVYAPAKSVLVEISTWGLLLAIGALGLGTSIKTIIGLGWRHITTVLGATAVIFVVVTGGLMLMRVI